MVKQEGGSYDADEYVLTLANGRRVELFGKVSVWVGVVKEEAHFRGQRISDRGQFGGGLS